MTLGTNNWPGLSRISPRVRVRVSVGIVYRIVAGGYSWIWPERKGHGANCPGSVWLIQPGSEKAWYQTDALYSLRRAQLLVNLSSQVVREIIQGVFLLRQILNVSTLYFTKTKTVKRLGTSAEL